LRRQSPNSCLRLGEGSRSARFREIDAEVGGPDQWQPSVPPVACSLQTFASGGFGTSMQRSEEAIVPQLDSGNGFAVPMQLGGVELVEQPCSCPAGRSFSARPEQL
jgi:hypothetical protein